jgi:hypothetical protein
MKRQVNKKVTIDKFQYEIFWVTQYIDHYRSKYGDSLHTMSFVEMENFARNCVFFDWKGTSVLGVGRKDDVYYQMVVYLNKDKKRICLKTCYKVTDSRIVKICLKLKI